MQIDTNKTLRQLYEEGVIGIGTKLYIEVPKGRNYISKEKKNGYENQVFLSEEIELGDKCYWEIALEPKNNEIFVIGEPFGNFELAGTEGREYGIEELNNICDKMFTTDYLKARSININDIYKVLEEEIIDNKVVQKEISYEDISIESNYYVYNKRAVKEKQGDIIRGKRDFWLASTGDRGFVSEFSFGPGAVYGGHVCSFYYNMFYSFGRALYMSVRPVGVLKSDIPIKDLPIFEIVIPILRIKLS